MQNAKAILVVSIWLSTVAFADDDLPDFGGTEISPPNAFVFLDPTIKRTWQGNTLDWYYNPAGCPFGDLLGPSQQALDSIEAATNFDFRYQGNISVLPVTSYDPARQGAVLVSCMSGAQMDAYIEDLINSPVNVVYDGYAYIWWAGTRINYGQIVLNSDTVTQSELRGLLTHEWLHALYLDHSDTPGSIMYTPYHTYGYQQTLRNDDLLALSELYPVTRPRFEAKLDSNGNLYIPRICEGEVCFEVTLSWGVEDLVSVTAVD